MGHNKIKGILPLLKEAQQKYGNVTPDVITQLASSLDMPLNDVYAVASFYYFLSLKPLGRHVIRVCKSLPCYLEHSADIVTAITGEIGIGADQTTEDGRFTLQLTNCIGLCDHSPAMLIDSDPHVNLTPHKISQILKHYK